MFEVRAVGVVESPLLDPASAPRQGDEGGSSAGVVVHPQYRDAVAGLRTGQDVLVLTWLHLADRETLSVHPRNDHGRPRQGVFSTRSADRPNPIGVHRVTITAIDGLRINVSPLEAVDQTPVLDIKPVLGDVAER